MAETRALLSELLAAAAGGRGVAGVSVVERAGDEPRTCWVPSSPEEPAYLAYSVTKTFTASLVLVLCDERRLRLEDPLARWFPRIDRAERISLRHLLNHTAGIPDYGGIAAYHAGVRAAPSTPWTFERFAAETFEKGLLFEPGEGWAYSNPGYMLLKRIVEEVAGQPYRGLVAERIAAPLGLSRTFVPESIADLAALAPGTSRLLGVDGASRDVRAHYHPGWVSHGVVASTPSDVARFLDALFHGRVLSARSLREMGALVPVPRPPAGPLRSVAPGYGLGLMGDPRSPWGLLLGHNGGGPCYGASAFHAPDLGGLSVCAMGAIEDGFSAEALVAAVLDAYVSGGPRAAQPPAPVAGS